MESRWRFGRTLAVLLFVGISASLVLAQDQDVTQLPANPQIPADTSVQSYPSGPGAPSGQPQQQQQVQDPSGRVARLQYMSGEVSMQPGGVNDWVAAATNRPLTTADRVWTDKNSRAELNVGDGFLRMDSETSLTLTNVSDSTVQLELDQGVLEVTVRHLQSGEIYEIDTPNFAFTVMKTGVYRFDVRPNEDQSWVTVRSGYGEATGKGAAVRVNSGLQVRFSGGNSLQHASYSAPARDGFDDWAQVRDKRLDSSLSARYVSPGVIGYQDLDNYGVWQTSPAYGAVWVPTVAPGWAPYRYGHWVWIEPWGWTWVDDAPWGFAPFHYGRWVAWNGGWGWAPGPYGYWNPYYSPALVGWIGGPGFGIGFGWGGGWGFSFGIGFGWFPLGWGEPFYPRYCGWGHGGWGYRGGYVSNTYLRNVNITNTHITNFNNVANNYRNNNLGATHYAFRNTAGAVTAAPRSAFTSGAAINRVGTVVPKSQLGRGQMVGMADVSPTRQSVLGGSSPARGVPPASATSRNVVTRATPPARPTSFGNQPSMARTNSAPAVNGAPATRANPNTAAGLGATRGASQENAAHNVPRPPAAGGTANNQMARANLPSNLPTHNVPRPPASNDGFARGTAAGTNGVNGRMPETNSQRNPQGLTTGRSTADNANVPRPPQNQVPRATNGTQHQPSASPQSGPAMRSAPTGRQSPAQSTSRGSGATSAPKPPAGYSYHAAPTYSGSSRSGAPGSTNGYTGGMNRGSYPYIASRSYGSSPVYGGRSGAPAYSAPHSSTPSSGNSRSYGGGGGSYHGGGGGGGSHSSGGGGGGGHHGR